MSNYLVLYSRAGELEALASEKDREIAQLRAALEANRTNRRATLHAELKRTAAARGLLVTPKVGWGLQPCPPTLFPCRIHLSLL